MEDIKITKKIAELLINLGEVQANEFSTLVAFYEPKVPDEIIKKDK